MRSLILLLVLISVLPVQAQNTSEGTDTSFVSNKSARTATDKKTDLIYQFKMMDEIAPPAWRLTKKALKEAKEMNADLILIHMNTYGGMLESADSIRTAILNSPIPVWVFIDNNAASAGALISIACDSIYMRPGANIGAATVVDQAGQVVPDKYQSYMRGLMRSTAEATGRDANIAQAMVDPKVVVPGISDSLTVITFTSSEAIKYGFCEGEAETIKDILSKYDLNDARVVKQELYALDHIIGFLTKPVISGILIMIIIGGLYFELQSPGIGFPIIASITAAALYFAPLYLEGLAANWEILVFIIGILLIALEIFVFPGFGVAGISGIVLAVLGLTLSLVGNSGFEFQGIPALRLLEALTVVIIASFLSILGSFYVTSRLFGRRTIFGDLALVSEQKAELGYVSADAHYVSMIGKSGTAYSILRPAGKVDIDGDIYDAVAQTGYIEKGESVVVIRYENSQLIVRKQ